MSAAYPMKYRKLRAGRITQYVVVLDGVELGRVYRSDVDGHWWTDTGAGPAFTRGDAADFLRRERGHDEHR